MRACARACVRECVRGGGSRLDDLAVGGPDEEERLVRRLETRERLHRRPARASDGRGHRGEPRERERLEVLQVHSPGLVLHPPARDRPVASSREEHGVRRAQRKHRPAVCAVDGAQQRGPGSGEPEEEQGTRVRPGDEQALGRERSAEERRGLRAPARVAGPRHGLQAVVPEGPQLEVAHAARDERERVGRAVLVRVRARREDAASVAERYAAAPPRAPVPDLDSGLLARRHHDKLLPARRERERIDRSRGRGLQRRRRALAPAVRREAV